MAYIENKTNTARETYQQGGTTKNRTMDGCRRSISMGENGSGSNGRHDNVVVNGRRISAQKP